MDKFISFLSEAQKHSRIFDSPSNAQMAFVKEVAPSLIAARRAIR
jgi:hypothetical protein